MITKKRCYFCGRTINLSKHHVIYYKKLYHAINNILQGVLQRNNHAEYLCDKCHKKFHKLNDSLVDYLASTIILLLLVIKEKSKTQKRSKK